MVHVTCKGSTRYWNDLEDYWPCAGGLLAVNAIGTHLGDLKKLGTDPMVVGILNKWTPSRKAGGTP